jgi:small subunit ribosomal protein S6
MFGEASAGKQEVTGLKTVIKGVKKAPSRKKKMRGEPKLYEAMFLVDSAEATTDWEGVSSAIKSILEKAGAEIVSIAKWDERKLAYEIGGKSKGTYILCYFKAEGSKLQSIERDIQLSDRIMRALILCAEDRPVEDTKRELVSSSASEDEAPKQTDDESDLTEEAEAEDAEDLEQAD